jgi:H(+)-translocating pyrophosphatase
MCGLWSGLIIGVITEIFTSNTYAPVQELADACYMGAAPNIILGLALGYMSTIIPIICIAITIFVSFSFAGMYGIALAALGMLGCLPIALSIDGYGPISDNAGGIAEMRGLDASVREATDKLDAAGNTTAAIGKGFAIGSACLVALALFGAFVTRAQIPMVNIMQPLEFSALLLGAMLPYAFSALTMSAVGVTANEMMAEIKRQFDQKAIYEDKKAKGTLKVGEAAWSADYEQCIAISTRASIKKMIAPGLLVICSPFFMGLLFGPRGVSGLLAGTIVSGVQVAFSFSNAGGAWDNAKKYVEAGTHTSKLYKENGEFVVFEKGSDTHKDTSGPSINILIKLSAITSLVFGTFFENTAFLLRL